MSRARKAREALEKLVDMYQYGALHAETDPASFMGMVCEELEALRGVQEAAERWRTAKDYCGGHGMPSASESGRPLERALKAHAAFTEKWGRQ